MQGNEPIIAIVGRPNVGKSTLFNRLAQKRRSIIHPQAGITRDRLYEIVNWAGKSFVLIDTGGFIPESENKIETAIREQVKLAIEEADLTLFLLDMKDGVMQMDREIAGMLRVSGKPVLLVVNKCDDEKRELNAVEFYELGFSEPYPISALNGRRIGDLLDMILEKTPKQALSEKEENVDLRLAIVGMPNAGKSSIANALIGEQKSIVTDIPGTTRDAIDTTVKYFGEKILLIDTAGLRKKSAISDSIEFYAMLRAESAIERANVVAVVVDAAKGFTRQDANIVRYVIDQKRAMIILLNKWDLVEKITNTLVDFQRNITDDFREIEHYPALAISALTKQRINKIFDIAKEVRENRKKRVTTSELNAFFQKVIDKTPPPAMMGKYIRIKYVTQVKADPPVFAFFCNEPKLVKEEYQRFLENQIRKGFGFQGVPLTISFREK